MNYAAALVVSFAMCGAMAQTSTAAPDQTAIDSDIALLRADLQTTKTAIITDTMKFTDDQAKVFWPLYREYSTKQQAIGDQRISLIKDYANQYATMTDDQAEALEGRLVKFEEARTKLAQSYYPKFKKALGAKQAVKFYQVENRLRLVGDLQIASAVPIIQ
jgi:hypothetical protein